MRRMVSEGLQAGFLGIHIYMYTCAVEHACIYDYALSLTGA